MAHGAIRATGPPARGGSAGPLARAPLAPAPLAPATVSAAMAWAPVVGLLLGLIAAIVLLLADRLLGPAR